jgi:hypothetical protein
MTLSISTSLPPMEALLVADLPRGAEWQYASASTRSG